MIKKPKNKYEIIIGSLRDTAKYIGRKGFNVLEATLQGKPWTKAKNIEWFAISCVY